MEKRRQVRSEPGPLQKYAGVREKRRQRGLSWCGQGSRKRTERYVFPERN